MRPSPHCRKARLRRCSKPENKDQLTAILTYHVVPAKVTAADVTAIAGNKLALKSVQGSRVTIDANDGVKVDNANVVATDVFASNGVIHVIDAVIMPKADGKRH